jgi:hypothetical protein
LAAGATLAALVALAAFWGFRLRTPTIQPTSALTRLEDAGRQALAGGKFIQAAEALEEAQRLRRRYGDRISPLPVRQFDQLRAQAAALAQLLAEPLGEVLQQAAELTALDEREWDKVFGQRFLGRAVAFDAEVRREASGRYELDYAVFLQGKRAVLDLGRAPVLEPLPLQRGQRLLLAVRLAEVSAGAEGIWAIHFDPRSVVLLTDLGAAAAACGCPPEDLAEVIERQSQWLAGDSGRGLETHESWPPGGASNKYGTAGPRSHPRAPSRGRQDPPGRHERN